MLRVVTHRLLLAVPLVFIVTAASFVLVDLIPGSAASIIAGDNPSPGDIARISHQLGLDQPLWSQYWSWLTHAIRGDLGVSIITGQPVTQILGDRLTVTVSLIICSLVFACAVGIALGVLSAVKGGRLGKAIDVVSVLGFALPNYWLALVLVAVFAVSLEWLPSLGYTPITDSPVDWAAGLILPCVALGAAGVAGAAKQTRDAMLDVLSRDFVDTLRAAGFSGRRIVLRHAVPNALIPTLTLMGTFAVGLLGGTALIEQIFVLPGLGSLAVSSAGNHDIPVMQGIVLYFTLIVIGLNLAVDLLCGAIDPRIRRGKQG